MDLCLGCGGKHKYWHKGNIVCENTDLPGVKENAERNWPLLREILTENKKKISPLSLSGDG